MRYRLAGGIEIRTENAAKPASQRSMFLANLIMSLPSIGATFDYGCGKLRYAGEMAARTETLTLIDSEIQLARVQRLLGRNTSIRELYKRSNHVAVKNDVEFSSSRARFDRGFCINVLSVIPSYQRRRQVLRAIHRALRPGARCLFVVQYRNSDFDRMKRMPNTKAWLDGFLVDSLRGFSFYGLITPEKLESQLRRCGFNIEDKRLNEGSAFIWASRR